MVIDSTTILDTLMMLSICFSTPVLLSSAVFGVIDAFFGYKLLKLFIRPISAYCAGVVTYEIIALYIPVDTMFPTLFGLNWTSIIVIVVAILAAILAPLIYKFIAGAIIGASICSVTLIYSGITNIILVAIVSGIVAILFGLIFIKIFKGLYILSTAFSGMMSTAFGISVMLFPTTFLYYMKEFFVQYFTAAGASATDIETALAEAGLATLTAPTDDISLLAYAGILGLGLVASIVAMIVQFKTNKNK